MDRSDRYPWMFGKDQFSELLTNQRHLNKSPNEEQSDYSITLEELYLCHASHPYLWEQNHNTRKESLTGDFAASYRNQSPIIWSPDKSSIHGIRHYEVPGFFNDIPINALPDSGSAVNAVSESFARRHGLVIKFTNSQTIHLPGGHVAESIGRTIGRFRFQGESHSYRREFCALRKSVYDLVLGRKFLTETRTLTEFHHRIIQRNRPCIQKGNRLFLMDESPKDRLRCAINGHNASAFPDTGSDLMIVSGEFVRRNGFIVHRGEKYRRKLELIDGSTIRTDGMVLDAELQFDALPASEWLDFNKYVDYINGISSLKSKGVEETPRTTFICDLHVVEDLSCDIILSNDFIFQNQVFSRFKDLFYAESTDSLPLADSLVRHGILFMRNIRKKFRWFSRRRRPSQGPTSPIPLQNSPTWDRAWETEEARRNQAQLWIVSLPEPQKSIEQRSENQKQEIWDRRNPRPPLTRLSASDPILRRRAVPGVLAS